MTVPPVDGSDRTGSTPTTATTAAEGAASSSSKLRSTAGNVVGNPMPHRLPEGENAAPLEVTGTTASDKLVIIMVGLPATGTYNK